MTDGPGSSDTARGLGAPGSGELPPGTIVGEYRVEGVLGKGGMGVVYAAVQPVIEKRAAIKVLNAMLSADRDLVRRFVDEARAVNRIRHDNIIDIFSFGQLPNGQQYFVMEYLEGATLAARLEKGDLPAAHLNPILVQICDALEAAHAKQIVHRDLKPENVWIALSSRGQPKVKLLDFGIAKLLATGERTATDVGAVIGTPHYMSPEQCNGRGVDHRTDIYALGVLMYRLFTGQMPIRGETFAEILAKQLTMTPEPPSALVAIPPALDRLIMRCLEKEADARPQSAAELSQALCEIFGLPDMSGPQPVWVPSAVALGETLDMPGANAPKVATIPGPHPRGPEGRSVVSVAGSAPGRRSRTGMVVALVAVAAAVVAAGAWFALRDTRPGGAPATAQPPTPPASRAASASATLPSVPSTAPAPAETPPSTAPEPAAEVVAPRPAPGSVEAVPAGAPGARPVPARRPAAARTDEPPPAPPKRPHDRASTTGLVTDNPFE